VGGLFDATTQISPRPKSRRYESSGRVLFPIGQKVCIREEEFFFLIEQYGDVIENKGPLWKTLGLSGNVYENKGDAMIRRECY
jgi:hypothetical protein